MANFFSPTNKAQNFRGNIPTFRAQAIPTGRVSGVGFVMPLNPIARNMSKPGQYTPTQLAIRASERSRKKEFQRDRDKQRGKKWRFRDLFTG